MDALGRICIVIALLGAWSCSSKPAPQVHEPPARVQPDAAPAAPTVDPEVQSWIDKLKSPATVERAILELTYLQDPAAIKPLTATWKYYNHAPRLLRSIIAIADQWYEAPLSVKQICRRKYTTDEDRCPDYETLERKRLAELYGKKYAHGPYWGHDGNAAFNALVEAVRRFIRDPSNATAIQNAETAIAAMRRAALTYATLTKRGNFTKQLPASIAATLVAVLNESSGLDRSHAGQKVRFAACRALGEFPTKRAVRALIQVLDKAHVPKSQHAKIFAVAADSLARIAGKNRRLAETATDALLVTLFAVPEVYQFVRRALVAIGPSAEDALIKVFKHQHPQVNRFADSHNFATNCTGDGGNQYGRNSTCRSPGSLRYKAAMLLGDLHSKKALPVLVDALHDRPVPAFFPRGGGVAPTQHLAIFEALQNIGDHGVANKLSACWLGPAPKSCNRCQVNGRAAPCRKNMLPKRSHCRCYTQLRAPAVNTYSFLARAPGDRAIRALGKLASSSRPTTLAFDAAIAYGRLMRSGRSLQPLAVRITALRKDLQRETKRVRRAEARLAALQRAARRSKSRRSKSRIARAQRAVAIHNKRKADYLSYLRTFEFAVGRAAIGMRCKGDAACYLQFIKRRRSRKVATLIGNVLETEARYWATRGGKGKHPLAAIKRLGYLPKQIPTWSLNDRRGLTLAVAERAALEVAKLGPKARGHTGELLQLLTTREPYIRDGLLLALLNVAQRPCSACVKRLDELIERDSKHAARAYMVSKATVWRNFFRWAK